MIQVLSRCFTYAQYVLLICGVPFRKIPQMRVLKTTKRNPVSINVKSQQLSATLLRIRSFHNLGNADEFRLTIKNRILHLNLLWPLEITCKVHYGVTLQGNFCL